MDQSQIVQVLELSQSSVITDSTYRSLPLQSPGNFETYLSGAIRDGKRIKHASMSWSQSFYAHQRENMLLRVRLSNPAPVVPSGDDWLYVFLTPYWMFTSPDGTDQNIPFATCVDGSYAADLQAALNTPFYRSSPTVYLPQAIGRTFTVSYSKSTGFLVSVDVGDFEILESSPWLQLAHDTHGFGVRIASEDDSFPHFASPTSDGPTDLIQSAMTPCLTPTRYVGVACREIAERRQLSSFSNVNSPAFNYGEVNVFPVSYAENGVWRMASNPQDPTIINMDPANGVQKLTLSLYNNRGQPVEAGNVWLILGRLIGSAAFMTIATTARNAAVSNALVNIWSNGQAYYTSRLTFPEIPPNVLCKSDEIVHRFLAQSFR